jgi:uncharacterized protein YneF (UPF0154 family)
MRERIYWVVIVVLVLVFGFFLGQHRAYSVVDDLYKENVRLYHLKMRAERLISQGGSEEAREAFRKIGFDIQ